MKSGLLAVLVGTCACASALALEPGTPVAKYGHRAWQSEEGLPQNSARAIVQTPDRYLWFGTEAGVARFDGTRIVVFNSANTPAIRSDLIMALAVDGDGVLWGGTLRGVFRRRGESFSAFATSDELSRESILSMAPDPKGGMWIGTTSSGAFHVARDKRTRVSVGSGLPDELVRALAVDRRGSVWIGTRRGVTRLVDGGAKTFTTADGLPDDRIYAIHEDRSGALWIGTERGLCVRRGERFEVVAAPETKTLIAAIREDSDGNLWIGTVQNGVLRRSGDVISRYSSREGLTDPTIASIFEDAEHTLWIGTFYGGVNQLRNTPFTSYGVEDGLGAPAVISVRAGREGTLWIGTAGGGLVRRRNGAMKRYTKADGLPSDYIRALHEADDGTMWIGTDGGGLASLSNGRFRAYSTNDGLPSNRVFSLTADRRGGIWVGTAMGLAHIVGGRVVNVLTDRDGLRVARILSLFLDRSGSLWIGTQGGGASRLRDGRFTTYGRAEGLASDVVISFHQEANGTMWLGTADGGLSRLRDGHFRTVNAKHGLHHDMVLEMVPDERGNLWIASNTGVFSVALRDLNAVADGRATSLPSRAFDAEDGMASRECGEGTPSATRTSDGRLWFATIRGLTTVDPTALERAEPPPLKIEDVVADGASSVHSREFGPGIRRLELNYTALAYASPQRVRFRYRLDGFDHDWVDAGVRRSAFYTNLSHGRYRFRVSARMGDGAWSTEEAAHEFEVKPHFYQTIPFFVTCVLLAIAAGLATHRVRMKLAEAKSLVAIARLSRVNESILRSAAEGIIGIDQEDHVTFVNASAARMLGRDAASLIGRPVSAFALDGEPAFVRGDGTTFPVDLNRAAMMDDAKRVVGAVVTFRDVTEQRAVEQMKAQLISIVSHELRTPMTSIRGSLGLLLSGRLGTLSAKAHRLVDIAVSNSDRLLRLISEILDVERMRSGTMALELRECSAATLMQSATDVMQAMADERGIVLRCHPVDVTIRADADRVIQTLTNLLSNAIKFTPVGGMVALSATDLGDELRMEVRDEGRGIPQDKLGVVFEPFQQLEAADAREKGGTGLGLPICRAIVEQHGGRIWIESECGMGSTFFFTVPVATRGEAREERLLPCALNGH